MVNDPIGDMIIQIKNGGMAGRVAVELPFSKMKFEVAKILAAKAFVKQVEKVGEEKKPTLKITLLYEGRRHAITDVKRISKPGLRWYVNSKAIPKVLGGMGIAILSTNKGIMTDIEAKKAHIGGELLCTIW